MEKSGYRRVRGLWRMGNIEANGREVEMCTKWSQNVNNGSEEESPRFPLSVLF